MFTLQIMGGSHSWSIAVDCKSTLIRVRRFESYPSHGEYSLMVKVLGCGSSDSSSILDIHTKCRSDGIGIRATFRM